MLLEGQREGCHQNRMKSSKRRNVICNISNLDYYGWNFVKSEFQILIVIIDVLSIGESERYRVSEILRRLRDSHSTRRNRYPET